MSRQCARSPFFSLAMMLLISAIFARRGSLTVPRGKIHSNRIFVSGKSFCSSSPTAPIPSAISAAVFRSVLLVPIISITALGLKP